jgi:predicted nucleotidyltransferase
MPVVATLLFGSLARSDSAEGSDTDLLMIDLDQETRHVSVGHLSLFLYPWSRLKADALAGDLFVCHLAREAKPLIDPDGYLPKLQEAFAFKPSYRDEIERATDLAWFLVKFGDELNPSLLFKRALWCIRTILIARSAELQTPVFAPERLADLTRSAAARKLLRERRRAHSEATVRSALREFLLHEPRPNRPLKSLGRNHFVERFITSNNEVALQTLKQEEESGTRYIR